jgi:phospholipid transport system transporter-binding protein
MQKTCIKPIDELTFGTVISHRLNFFKQLMADKTGKICLDLAAIKQCDSAGLALLIEAKKLCKQYNKQFEIQAMPEKIRALAEFCGVESLLNEL